MNALGLLLLLAESLIPLDEAGFRKLILAQRGHVTLVSFWATWCAPCREELPALASLQKRFPDVRILTISADEPEAAVRAQTVLAEAGVQGAAWIRSAISDDAFIAAIDRNWSGAIPAAFLYDRKGRLVRAFIGETKPVELANALRKAMAH